MTAGKGENPFVKVGVSLITHNQRAFIEAAVESVLMQEVGFPYELVIGDDASTDGTREIVCRYACAYPDRVRLVLHPFRVGLLRNFSSTLSECCGEYIAMLDGDDYWTSPEKLRKQVDFLDAHPQCSLCCHGAVELFEDGRTLASGDRPGILSIEDLLRENFCYSSSVMLRASHMDPFPAWFHTLAMEDYPTFVLAAQHGPIGYLNEHMLVYRVHAGGAWSGLPLERQVAEEVRVLRILNGHLGGRYDKQIRANIERLESRKTNEVIGESV